MATQPSPIDPRLIELAQQLAAERNCSVADVLHSALDQIEQPRRTTAGIVGLFGDAPEVVDQVLEDAYRARETDRLRQSENA